MAKRKARTKSQLLQELADEAGVTRKQVASIFENLSSMIATDINPRSRVSPGVFTIPGICRIKTRVKPARKARKGINPFTGEEMMFKAKPKTNVIKILPVKALKDTVA